jgi:hypothetical protein
MNIGSLPVSLQRSATVPFWLTRSIITEMALMDVISVFMLGE